MILLPALKAWRLHITFNSNLDQTVTVTDIEKRFYFLMFFEVLFCATYIVFLNHTGKFDHIFYSNFCCVLRKCLKSEHIFPFSKVPIESGLKIRVLEVVQFIGSILNFTIPRKTVD